MIPIDKLNALPLDTLEALHRSLVDVIKRKRYLAASQTMVNLQAGQVMSFYHRSRGETVQVTVKKVNHTRALCQEIGGMRQSWNVPAHMLQAA